MVASSEQYILPQTSNHFIARSPISPKFRSLSEKLPQLGDDGENAELLRFLRPHRSHREEYAAQSLV